MSRWLKFACLVVATGQVWAQQTRRLALVVGVSAYSEPVSRLAAPLDDAASVQAALEKVGFSVTSLVDPVHSVLVQGLKNFTSSVRPGDVAFFYYAGHGLQVQGRNYLLPRDFSGTRSSLGTEGIPADDVIRMFNDRSPKLKILVFDACRDNPFGDAPGLAEMQAPAYGSGTYIAMSAAPNEIAGDGRFAKHLASALATPGLSLDEVFIKVRAAVVPESGNRQHPFSTDVQVENFYFVPALPKPANSQSRPAALSKGFFGYASPEADQYVRISYSGFPSSVTAGRALELYFRDYLNAFWHTDDESHIRRTLWLEVQTNSNVSDRRCSSSLGFGVAIRYHFDDEKETIPQVTGVGCYGSVAADAEKAATEEAIQHLRDAIFRH